MMHLVVIHVNPPPIIFYTVLIFVKIFETKSCIISYKKYFTENSCKIHRISMNILKSNFTIFKEILSKYKYHKYFYETMWISNK